MQLRATGASSYISFDANNAEGMRLTSTGLGIGTTSPQAKLVVSNAGAAGYEINPTGGIGGGATVSAYNRSTSAYTSLTTYASTMTWYNGSTRAMDLDASGRLLVGTTGDVSAGGYFGAIQARGSYPALVISGTETSARTWQIGENAGNLTFYDTTGGERARISAAGGFSVGTTADPGAGAIYATGNITAYYSSDIKFKENVRDIPDALATVNAIGGKLFDWTDDYIESKGGADGYFVQKADFGVVAQDVQKVFPIAVRTREDGSLAVDYEKLGALAFAALVELTKRVEALESK
jgi:hypothetical protein